MAGELTTLGLAGGYGIVDTGGGSSPVIPRTLYWVGGTGTLDDPSHWSLSSGGAGGQAVPVELDTVIFDASSGGGSVTKGALATWTALALTFGAFTGILNLSAMTLNFGSVSGTGTTTRTFNVSNSTLNVTGVGGTPWNFATVTGLAFTSTGSTINLNGGGSRTLNFGALTYAIVNITGTGADVCGNQNAVFGTLNMVKAGGVAVGNFTSTNLTAQGPATNNRLVVSTSNFGTQRTLTVANAPTIANADLVNITAAGASSPWILTGSVGDGTGNTNITFPAAKTVYRVGSGNYSDALWATTSGGATSLGNLPLLQDTAIVDLNSLTAGQTLNYDMAYIGAQDWSAFVGSGRKAIYNNTVNSRVVGNFNVPFGPYDAGTSGSADVISAGIGFTTTFSTQGGRTIDINISASNISVPGGQTYLNNGFRSIVSIQAPGGTVRQTGHLIAAAALTHLSGTFAMNGYNSQFTTFASIGTATRAITTTSAGERMLASSNSQTGTPIFDFTATGLTLTGTFQLETFSASSTDRILNLAGLTLGSYRHHYHDGLNSSPNIKINGGATFTGAFAVDTQSPSVSTPVSATYTFQSGTTVAAASFSINGYDTSSKVVVLSSAAGSRATLSDASGTNTFDYVALKDMAFTGGATWNATHANDNGNNTGISISA